MKSIAIAASQGILAAGIVAMGVALLAGTDFGPQRIMTDAIGDVGRTLVGAVEIIAGLCLLFPRGHVIGTLLLAVVTVGLLGVIIGRSADGGSLRLASPKHLTAIYSSDARVCESAPGAGVRLTSPRELAI